MAYHGVWKSQKKSYSTLRAKRAMFTFWVDKSSLKMPKIVHFGEFLKTWSLRSNSVTRQVNLIGQKLVRKCQILNVKIEMRHFLKISSTMYLTVKTFLLEKMRFFKSYKFALNCLPCRFWFLKGGSENSKYLYSTRV